MMLLKYYVTLFQSFDRPFSKGRGMGTSLCKAFFREFSAPCGVKEKVDQLLPLSLSFLFIRFFF